MRFSKNKTNLLLSVCLAFLLQGCINKDVQMSEQQKRMARCDQYIGQSREECLNGMNVTIEDYKQDYREFKRSEEAKKAEEAAKSKALIKKPASKSETKENETKRQ